MREHTGDYIEIKPFSIKAFYSLIIITQFREFIDLVGPMCRGTEFLTLIRELQCEILISMCDAKCAKVWHIWLRCFNI